MNYSLGNMLSRGGALNPDGLSLDLAFAADKTLTARKGPTPTFTRASTATFVGSNGLIQSAAINTPRFDHNPNTLVSLGLLIEELRINLLNGSQTFATSGGIQNNWVDTNITRDGTLRTSPDGTSNALRITASAANGTVISSAAAGSSAARVFSIFLRRVTGTGDIQYTLDNGSTWTTQAITSSWVRYTFAATTANQQVGIRIVTSGDAVEIWGAQLEAGSFPTSYIPTTTTALTRSADVCSITGANFTSFYNQSEGSFACDYSIPAGFTGNRYAAAIEDTPGGLINAYTFRSTNTALNFINTGGYTSTIGVVTVGLSKHIIAYSGVSEFVYCKDGTIGSNTGSGTRDPSILIRLGIGTLEGANGFSLNGHIARIQYYRKRLTNAKLQSLTTA